MSDLIERTKPTDEGLCAEWSPSVRREVLDDALAGRSRGVTRRRPWPLAVAACLLAGLVLAVPVVFPAWFGGSAAADELGRVARAAGEQPRLEWGDDQFLRVQSEEVQTVSTKADFGWEGTRRVTHDDYFTTDGWTWSDRTVYAHGPDGRIERYIFPPAWGWLRPDYAAGMPTEPHLLDVFLRARVAGSSSQDEAVFVAIGDMLRQEAAPPEVRAAAIGVLALNAKVTVEHTADPQGRPSLEVTFVDQGTRPGMRQFLHLDPDSGVLLASGTEGDGFTYQKVITNRDVVEALPAELVEVLGTEKAGKDVADGVTRSIPHKPGPDPVPGAEQSWTPAPTR